MGGFGAPRALLQKWLVHSDPRLVATFTRHFWWYENVLWLDADDLDGAAAGVAGAAVRVFVSERDRYIDGPTIFADAQAEAARRRRAAVASAGGAPTSAAAVEAAEGRRALRAVMWEGLDHGEFQYVRERRREVVRSVVSNI